MSKIYSIEMVKILSEAYNERLKYFLEEVDAYDKKGNPILSMGLKLRHKTSGYEYTVLGYENVDGKEYLMLRNPDEPRGGLEKSQGSTSLVKEDEDYYDDYSDRTDGTLLRPKKKRSFDSKKEVPNDEVHTSDEGYEYILVSIDKIKSDYDI